MKQHSLFIFTSNMLIAIIVITVSYLTSIFLGLREITFSKIGLVFFLQSLTFVLASYFVLKNDLHKYLEDVIGELKKPINGFIFALFFSFGGMLTVILLDYIFSFFFDFGMSEKYGVYLDTITDMPQSTIDNNNSFKALPLTLQNLILNILSFFIIFIISFKMYKKGFTGMMAKI